jgi:hypothetical protein
MNERNSLHLVSTLFQEVLVMLVNEFVLSTEIVVQKCRAKYFCTAFTRGYQGSPGIEKFSLLFPRQERTDSRTVQNESLKFCTQP